MSEISVCHVGVYKEIITESVILRLTTVRFLCLGDNKAVTTVYSSIGTEASDSTAGEPYNFLGSADPVLFSYKWSLIYMLIISCNKIITT